MLPLPLWTAIDRAFFRQDRKLRRRLLGAVVVGFILGVTTAVSLREERDAPTALYGACVIGACVVACVAVVLGLMTRDVLQRRIRSGEPVNLLLRLYFASGWLTMAVWVASAVVATLLACAISAHLAVLGHGGIVVR